MKWKKYTIETTEEGEEAITGMLFEMGITGVQVEDKKPLTEEEKKKMFVDILPEPEYDGGKAYITFYLEIPENQDILSEIQKRTGDMRQYLDVGSCHIQQDITEDEDWINNWKQYFKPFYIDDILIKPTWESLPKDKEYAMYLDIDPGIAFGTGMHETTRLCIRSLRKYVTGETTLLDVGCGSGILSIMGIKTGAKNAVAVDIDPDAVKTALENAQVNGVSGDVYRVFAGNILEEKEMRDKIGYECYDIVVANILADVIIPLQKMIAPHMKHGAKFISSGIINTREEEVVLAIRENPELEIEEITRDGDWVSVTAYRR